MPAEKQVTLKTASEVLAHVKKVLASGALDEAIDIYNRIVDIKTQNKLASNLKAIISSSIKVKFSEFIGGDAMQSSHYESYLHGIQKKIDITVDEPPFSGLAKSILSERRTLLYYDRLYTIYQALKFIKQVGGCIFEVGVYRGGSLKFIAEACGLLNIHEPIYGLDTFSGHAGVTSLDFSQCSTQFSDTSYSEVVSYLSDFSSVTVVEGDVRNTLLNIISRVDRIVFAHLDLDLYEPTLFCLRKMSDKFSSGGMVVLDDYGFVSCDGVRNGVDEFVAESGWGKMHLMTGQCILYCR